MVAALANPQHAGDIGELPEVIGQEKYAWWSLDAVARAWDRAQSLDSMWLSRYGFLDVFTDYTVVRDGKFLALPLGLFEVFARRHELGNPKKALPKRSWEVDAREVLLVLTLFCSGNATSQVNQNHVFYSVALYLRTLLSLSDCCTLPAAAHPHPSPAASLLYSVRRR